MKQKKTIWYINENKSQFFEKNKTDKLLDGLIKKEEDTNFPYQK